MRKICLTVAGVVVIVVVAYQAIMSGPAEAQSGTRYGDSQTRYGDSDSGEPRAPFESRFWDFLVQTPTAYRQWAPWPGTDGGMYPGDSPHGAYLKMYVNRVAAGNPDNPPHGSIIIKENFGPDKKTLMAVTAMYRSKGYDPENNDWYWVKYLPDGTVARTPQEKGSMRIAGRFKSCINCHSSADGGDLIFANDGGGN